MANTAVTRAAAGLSNVRKLSGGKIAPPRGHQARVVTLDVVSMTNGLALYRGRFFQKPTRDLKLTLTILHRQFFSFAVQEMNL